MASTTGTPRMMLVLLGATGVVVAAIDVREPEAAAAGEGRRDHEHLRIVGLLRADRGPEGLAGDRLGYQCKDLLAHAPFLPRGGLAYRPPCQPPWPDQA